MIAAGIVRARARIMACGDMFKARGRVQIHVHVNADGNVDQTSVLITPGPELGSCVGAAMAKATFTPTQVGGSFSYPFVF